MIWYHRETHPQLIKEISHSLVAGFLLLATPAGGLGLLGLIEMGIQGIAIARNAKHADVMMNKLDDNLANALCEYGGPCCVEVFAKILKDIRPASDKPKKEKEHEKNPGGEKAVLQIYDEDTSGSSSWSDSADREKKERAKTSNHKSKKADLRKWYANTKERKEKTKEKSEKKENKEQNETPRKEKKQETPDKRRPKTSRA